MFCGYSTLRFSRLAFVFLLPVLSFRPACAQPPASVLNWIQQTYRPGVTAVEDPVPRSILLGHGQESTVLLTAQDPVTGQPGSIQLRLYRPQAQLRGASGVHSIMILPPTGGETVLDRLDSERLCEAGFRVALMEHWDGDTFSELDLDMHDRGALRALAAIRHVTEYLDPTGTEKLGILGTSVGAIEAALALGDLPQIGVGALIVGGGGMPDIIAHSTVSSLAQLRDARMKELGYSTVDDYQQALAAHVHIDPLDFAGLTGKKALLMMIGTEDQMVPTRDQYALQKAWDDAPALTHDADHVHTIVYTSAFEFGKFIQFFTQYFHDSLPQKSSK